MKKITESRNPLSDNLDIKSTSDILSIINSEDQVIPNVIESYLSEIEIIIKHVINSFNSKGRLYYVGCGTSGRLGVLDASECPPTFKVDKTLVQGIIAGGDIALRESVENAEDSYEDGYNVIKSYNITNNDTVIGISASGTAKFVLGSLKSAKESGAYTSLITFNKISSLNFIDKILSIIIGPEIISGSTRMKAGTATKMILNMISTVSLVKSHKVYKNYMVDLNVNNEKLKNRAINIIKDICDIRTEKASLYLYNSDSNVKVAIVMYKLDLSKKEALIILEKHNGNLRKIIE
tara:strand:+ start:234 stop:1112 length:879 start_codon:yes stop_codon:yes gene_type:complete